MQNIKKRDILIYATMPRILPRVKNLFASGFAYISFLMAHIYFMVRLLPASHPYLSSENMGRFGVRHVIMEASRNLKFSVKNIDQLVIYFAMLAGVVILVAQIIVLGYSVIISPAMAFSWFNTPNPQTDIAFTLLDRVFGIPGIFCSAADPSAMPPIAAVCTDYAADTNGAAVGTPTIPLPFHVALHGLFEFYSTALLSVAILIFLYFVVVVIFETATSGTPFGQRFQNIWVPIRLIVALALLVPVTHGLGSGQYIVLYAAKFGSSFATTGWREFNDGIASHQTISVNNPTGEKYSMLAIPEAPDITPVIEAMSIVHACAYTYHRMFAEKPNQGIIGMGNYPSYDADYTGASSISEFRVMPFFAKNLEASMVAGAIGNSPIIGDPWIYRLIPDANFYSYMDALGFYYGSDIIIRFGEMGINNTTGNYLYPNDTGHVRPFCGDIRIPVVDLRAPGGAIAAPSTGGADAMLKFYYELIMELWFDDETMRQFARSYVEASIGNDENHSDRFCNNATASGTGSGVDGLYADVASCKEGFPTVDWREATVAEYNLLLISAIQDAWSDHVNNSIYGDMSNDILAYGWGGAGIWYNKIAEVNGGWISAVAGIPTMDRYPLAMEQVHAEKKQQNEAIEFNTRFEPTVKAQGSEGKPVPIKIEEPFNEVAVPLADLYSYWNKDAKNFNIANRDTKNNIFMDSLNRLMGTGGLAAMRTSNANLHPLAQLIMVGKGLVDSAVINLAGSTGSAFLGGMAGAMKGYEKYAAVLNAASEILLSTAFMGLTAGFVLYYVLPFLPFLYFFFAVASWIKTIFEAMVGVPLWALAHLRIDGDGLPGEAAQNGYFLILDIFIRPILTVVGLVAAIIIFSTQVRVLNLLWDLVVANTAGHSPTGNDILGMNNATDARFQRSIVDQFFFTVIYTIVCYMMALASFKLIDKIPDNILRWAGAGVQAFGDINQDNVDSLSRYAAMGGMTIGNQAAGAVKSAGAGAGGGMGKMLNDATSDPAPAGVSKRPN